MSNFDEEIQKEKNKIYKFIEKVINEMEICLEDLKFSESFLDHNSKSYTHFGTYSFTLGEHRLKDAK